MVDILHAALRNTGVNKVYLIVYGSLQQRNNHNYGYITSGLLKKDRPATNFLLR